WTIRSAGSRAGSSGRPFVSLPLSPRLANYVYQVCASDHRTRSRKSPLRQLLFGCLLVPDGASRDLSCAAGFRAEDSPDLSGGRTGKCGEVIWASGVLNLRSGGSDESSVQPSLPRDLLWSGYAGVRGDGVVWLRRDATSEVRHHHGTSHQHRGTRWHGATHPLEPR